MNEEFHCHVDTIRKWAYEVDWFGWVARKKPYVNKINRENGLNSPRKYWKVNEFLKEYCLVQRVKIQSFGSDSKIMVWRTAHEEFDPKCINFYGRERWWFSHALELFHSSGSLENCVCIGLHHKQILLSR